MKDLVTIKDFRKLDFHVGKITEAERIVGSEKLLLLKVDLGKAADSDESETREYVRQIVAGLGKVYDPAWLIGKEVIILVNLEPKMIMGIESQGMLVAADDGGRPVLLLPEREVSPGAVLC